MLASAMSILILWEIWILRKAIRHEKATLNVKTVIVKVNHWLS